MKVLLELYKVAVEEYRFQINLNWARSKSYVLLNSALIISTYGLLRLPSFKFAEFLTAPLFLHKKAMQRGLVGFQQRATASTKALAACSDRFL